jgi:hypothetical protein
VTVGMSLLFLSGAGGLLFERSPSHETDLTTGRSLT